MSSRLLKRCNIRRVFIKKNFSLKIKSIFFCLGMMKNKLVKIHK